MPRKPKVTRLVPGGGGFRPAPVARRVLLTPDGPIPLQEGEIVDPNPRGAVFHGDELIKTNGVDVASVTSDAVPVDRVVVDGATAPPQQPDIEPLNYGVPASEMPIQKDAGEKGFVTKDGRRWIKQPDGSWMEQPVDVWSSGYGHRGSKESGAKESSSYAPPAKYDRGENAPQDASPDLLTALSGAQTPNTGPSMGISSSSTYQSPAMSKEASRRLQGQVDDYSQQSQDAYSTGAASQQQIAQEFGSMAEAQSARIAAERDRYAQIDNKLQQIEQQYATKLSQLNQTAEDPDRYIKSMPTVQKVLFVLQAAAGGFTEAYTGGQIKNKAFDMLNKAITRDIAAQRANFERRLADLKLTGQQANAMRQQVEQSLNRHGRLVQAYTGMIAAKGLRQAAAAELAGKGAQAGVQSARIKAGLEQAGTGRFSKTTQISPMSSTAPGAEALTKKETDDLPSEARAVEGLFRARARLASLMKKASGMSIKDWNARRQFFAQQLANIIQEGGRALSDQDRAQYEKSMKGIFNSIYQMTGRFKKEQFDTFNNFVTARQARLNSMFKSMANRQGVANNPMFRSQLKYALSYNGIDDETKKYLIARLKGN